jgi:hypothetical protein
MPFRSVKQRKFMFAKHPEIAKKWVAKYGGGIVPSKKKKKK